MVGTRSLGGAVLAVAGYLVASSTLGGAYAADLGGDCCADLEERVAELEATTARKGNRKVSLTVSGWVNEAVFFWDDGVESNAYVGTNDLEQDRFRFVGEAKIADGWSAGYTLEIGLNGADSKTFSQDFAGHRQQRRRPPRQLVPEEQGARQGHGRQGRPGDLPPARQHRLHADPQRLGRRGCRRLSSRSFQIRVNGVLQCYQVDRPHGRLQQRHPRPVRSAQRRPLRYADHRRLHRHGLLGRGRHVGHGARLQERDRRLQGLGPHRLRRKHRSDRQPRPVRRPRSEPAIASTGAAPPS